MQTTRSVRHRKAAGGSSPAGSSSSSAAAARQRRRRRHVQGRLHPAAHREPDGARPAAANGQRVQTGQSGTVVVHAKTRHAQLAPRRPAGLGTALAKLCSSGDHVAHITSPWASIDCRRARHRCRPGNRAAAEQGRARTAHRQRRSGRATRTLSATSPACYDSLKKLSSATTQYEFTGGGFENLAERAEGHAAGGIRLHRRADHPRDRVPHARRGRASAAQRGRGAGHRRSALISLLSHVMNVATFATAAVPADGDRRRRRLRPVHRHPASAKPAARHVGRASRSRSRSTPPGVRCCSPGSPSASRCSACARSASASCTASRSAPSISVALTMIASLTLLPAVLSLLGLPVLPRKVRKAIAGRHLRRAGSTRPGGPGGRTFVVQHKLVLGSSRRRRDRRARHPVLLDAAGPRRREHRPDRDDHPQGLRPDHATPSARATTRRWNWSSSGPTATDPSYLGRAVPRELADGARRRHGSVHPAPLGKDLAFVTFKTHDLAAGRRRPPTWSRPCARDVVPGMEQGIGEQGLRLRADGDPRRLRQGAQREDPAVLRRDHRAVVPAADGRLPQPASSR